jgi:hypothetical protein
MKLVECVRSTRVPIFIAGLPPLCVCVFIFVFVFLCVFIYVCVCLCVCVYLFVCLFVCLCLCVCVFSCVCMFVYVCVFVCVCICLFVFVCVCVFCVCVFGDIFQTKYRTCFVYFPGKAVFAVRCSHRKLEIEVCACVTGWVGWGLPLKRKEKSKLIRATYT